DEGIARYQTEFAAGKGGKGKKYKMYKCAKLKTFRLCMADHPKFGDPLCVKGGKRRDGTYSPITNPIKDYLFWKKIELRYLHRSQIPKVPAGEPQKQSNNDTPNKESNDAQNKASSGIVKNSPKDSVKMKLKNPVKKSLNKPQKKSEGNKK
ncbi:MAG: hypothetical protein ACTSYU_14205, partial [Promethearchaeota archaeon]